MSLLPVLVATHTAVAALAWLNGRLWAAWTQRPPHITAGPVIDLTRPRPYDWAIDGDGAPPAACPCCDDRGWLAIPDRTVAGLTVDLIIDCPACHEEP